MDKKLKKNILKSSKKEMNKKPTSSLNTDTFSIMENNNYGVLKKLNSLIPFILTFNIIMILYVGSIIYYLHQIKNCQCFIEKNKNNYTNINYLLIIEYIILSVNVFMVLILIFIFNNNSKSNLTKKGGAIQNFPTPFLIYFCLIFVVYSFFVYYVYKLHENITEDCECSKSWLRYLLYIQSVMIVLSLTYSTYKIIF